MSQKIRQTHVRNLTVVLACSAALLWAWRYSAESARPLTARDWARSIESGKVEDKKLAAQKLGESTPDEIELVVPALVRALADKDTPVRAEATFILGQYMCACIPVGPPGLTEQARATAGGLLVALKDDKDPVVRASAAFALSAIRQALVKARISSNEELASDPIKRETLVAAFDEALLRDPANRLAMIDAIERLGTLQNEATPGLLEALNDPSIIVRGRVIITLSHCASGVDPAIPVLLHDLESNTSRFPPDYFEAAKQMHPSPAVVPVLIKSLDSDNWMVREAVAMLLSQVTPPARAAAPALIAAIKKTIKSADNPDAGEDSASSKGSAAGGMARSGTRPDEPERGTVSPSFTKALLQVAAPEDATPILLEILRGKTSRMRAAGATALAQLGPKANAAIPTLLATLKQSLATTDNSAAASSKAILLALGRVASGGPETVASSEAVIAALRDALGSPADPIRAAAAEALGNFGPRASSAIPRLSELQKEKAGRARDAATDALKKISPESKPTSDPKS